MKALIPALLLFAAPALAQDSQLTWFLSNGEKLAAVTNKDDSFQVGNFHCEANSAETANNGVVWESSRLLTCVSKTEVKVTGATCRSYSKTPILQLPPIQLNGNQISLTCRIN